ncbi:MAG TPA: zf-HC2 domain-containing protein [Thermoanaerobaculia bacterium]|jgi:hypothetical protein|nr:zf-HC2 domain-containing protein [Thermoanaerobaculia bacterium]
MNCEQATELLPWYLNGTLDESERREVREHLAGCEGCRQALEDTRLAWTIYDQHIPSEALVALAWGESPEGYDPDVLERHLRSCPECAAELELVRTSRRLEEDGNIALFPVAGSRTVTRKPGAWRTAALAASLAGMVAASGWIWTAGQTRDLERRLAEARPAPTAPAPAAPQAPPQDDAAARQKLAEMSAQVETLRKQTDEMREQLTQIADAGPRPQVNVWVDDLRPTSDVVRGGPGEVKELPAGTAAVAMLEPGHEETHKNHRIEVVDAAGKVVWKADELHRSSHDDFAVLLPALKAGSYTIRLSAMEGPKRVELESYAIRVR